MAPGIQQIRRERPSTARLSRWLWALAAIYSAARVAQAFPDRIPIVAIVALHVLPPLAFALLHGAVVYRPRGILVFVVLAVRSSHSARIGLRWHGLSVLDALRLGRSPAWTLSGVILGDPGERLTGRFARLHAPTGGCVHYGGVGSFLGSRVVQSGACLDLAGRWRLVCR